MITEAYRPAERVPVRRVQDTTGSHIEPPLSHDWTELCKAEWCASVVEHETGLPITFGRGGHWINGRKVPGIISVQVGGSSTTMRVSELWSYLSAVGVGATQMARELGAK